MAPATVRRATRSPWVGGWWLALLTAGASSGCGDDGAPPSPAATPTALGSAATAAGEPGDLVLPPRRPFDPNPLNLPPAAVTLDKGQLVFVVPDRALEHAREGSTMVLRAGRVQGMDGSNILVRIRYGPIYPVHPGYVIVPSGARPRRGGTVLVNSGGVPRHAVVRTLLLDKVVVRITDAGRKLGDRHLPREDVGALGDGLSPGAYAVLREGQRLRHVLLVSAASHAGTRKWLVLAYGFEARVVAETSLSPLPSPFKTKVGRDVMVAWRGEMVPATVRAVDDPGLYTVKRARAGHPLVVGPGMLMDR